MRVEGRGVVRCGGKTNMLSAKHKDKRPATHTHTVRERERETEREQCYANDEMKPLRQ